MTIASAKNNVRSTIQGGESRELTGNDSFSVIPAKAGIQDLGPGSSPGRRSHSPTSDKNLVPCCISENSPLAIVLLSGGIDSSTCLAIARTEGYRPCALSFRYQQRHEIELQAAGRVAESLGVERRLTLDLPLGKIGGSALTADFVVPKNRSLEELTHGIPITYVPARNTVFLALALAWSEVLGARDIFIGVNALDYSGYPDCRPDYIEAFERMANLATKSAVEGSMRVKIHTPLIHMTKAEIIRRAVDLGVDLRLTHSCYDPDEEGAACGTCDSCLLRKKGFLESGIPDPTVYSSS